MWSGWFIDVPHGIRRVGVVPEHVHAAEAGVERSVGRHLAERPAAAVALRRRVDHPRVHARGRARSRVRAGRARRPAGSRPRRRPLAHSASASSRPALGGEVERDAAAAAALVVEREAPVDQLDLAAAHAQHVEVGPRLDLDHVGAELRQDAAELGHHRGDAELDDPDAVEQELATVSERRAGTRCARRGEGRRRRTRCAGRRIDDGVRASRTRPRRERAAPRARGKPVSTKKSRPRVCGWSTNSLGWCSTPTVAPRPSASSNSSARVRSVRRSAATIADHVGVHEPEPGVLPLLGLEERRGPASAS